MRTYYIKAMAFLLAFLLTFGLLAVPVSAGGAIVPPCEFLQQGEPYEFGSFSVFEPFFYEPFDFITFDFEPVDYFNSFDFYVVLVVSPSDDGTGHSLIAFPFDEVEPRLFRARHYNPYTLIGTQEDPMFKGPGTDPQGLNLYLYCQGNPVKYVDPTGLIIELESAPTAPKRENYKTDKTFNIMWKRYESALKRYEKSVQEYDRAIEYLKQSECFERLYNQLIDSDVVFNIEFINNFDTRFSYKLKTIYWDPTAGLVFSSDKKSVQSASIGLAHEMGHAAQSLDPNIRDYFLEKDAKIRAMATEQDNMDRYDNIIASQLYEYVRGDYENMKAPYRMPNSTTWGTLVNPHRWFRPNILIILAPDPRPYKYSA